MPEVAALNISVHLDFKTFQADLRRLESLGGDAGAKVGVQFSQSVARGVQQQSGTLSNVFAGIFQGIGQQITHTLVGAFQTGVGALQNFVGESRKAAMDLEVLTTRLNFVAGSAEAGANQLAFVRSESQRLALPLKEAAEGFVGLSAAAKGTTLEGQGVRDTFSAVAQASRVFGLSAEQTNGALLALQQMVSKGTVSAEELRGQLGERLPGAFQIAARAMGVTTSELDEMLKKGEVVAGDFLPKFAAQLSKETNDGLAGAMGTASAKSTELSNKLLTLRQNFGEALEPAFSAALATAATMFDGIGLDLNAINIASAEFAKWLERNRGTIQLIAQGIATNVNGAINGIITSIAKFNGYLEKNPGILKGIGVIVNGISWGYQQWGKLLGEALKLVASIGEAFGGVVGVIETVIQKAEALWDSFSKWKDASVASISGSLGGGQNSGGFNFPIQGGSLRQNIVGGGGLFGAPRPYGGHSGQDYAYKTGTPVHAPIDGEIVQQASNKGEHKIVLRGMVGGKRVEVGLVHLDTKNVSVGDRVRQGQRVGTVGGAKGSWGSTGAHLHMDVRVNGRLVNPQQLDRVLAVYGTGGEGAPIQINPNTISGFGTGSAATNRQRYLRYIAEMESGGNINARNKKSGATGAFQFLPSTQREELGKSGANAYAPSFNEQSRAAWNYIRRMSPQAAAAVEKGDFRTADKLLNRLWTSLPGGSEAASGERLARGRTHLNNPPPNQRITTTGGVSSGTSSAKKSEADKKKAEADAKKATAEARKLIEERDRKAAERRNQERADRDAAFRQATERGAIGKTGEDAKLYDIQRKSMADLRQLQDKREDLVSARNIKLRDKITGGIDYTAAIKNIDKLIAGEKNLTKVKVDSSKVDEARKLIQERDAQNAERRQQERESRDRKFRQETERGGLGKTGVEAELYNTQRAAQAELQKLQDERQDLIIARDIKIRDKIKGGIDYTAEIAAMDDLIAGEQALTQAKLSGISADAARKQADEARIALSQQVSDALDYQARREELFTELRTRAAEAERQEAQNSWDYAQRRQRLSEIILASQAREAEAEAKLEEDRNRAMEAYNTQLEETWNKAHELHRAIVDGVGSAITDAFKAAITGTKSLGEIALDLIGNLASRLADLALNSIMGSAGGGGILGSLFSGLFGGPSKAIQSSAFSGISNSFLPIPFFGDGGIVRGPTLAVVGEKGPEAITPLNKMGGTTNINLVVNNTGSGQMSAQQSEALSRQVGHIVETKLIEHKRPGGLFS